MITPPDDPPISGPVIFLAGPIQGAKDWQAEAARLIGERTHVANPRRPVFPEGAFDEQVWWESRWLARATVILFWLAAEHEHRCDQAYAQTTRFELGEWMAKAPERVVVGGEASFTGLRYLRARGISVHETLDATIEEAVRRAVG
jgi:hypothetical protein